MKFTKQTFELVADSIFSWRNTLPQKIDLDVATDKLIEEFSERFAMYNPNFDSYKFFRACTEDIDDI